MKDFSKLEKKLDVEFKNKDLLIQSVVHRSYLNEHPNFKLNHNERLEYLGDAVLELAVTEYLFKKFPEATEGDLTNWRASLVNSKMLSTVARELDIEKFLFLSKGESKDANSKARQYILANVFEALVGAIFLDQGLTTSKKFIKKYLIVQLDNILENKLYLDPKSKFQENAQDKVGVTPAYKVIKEFGPDHNKIFEVGVFLEKEMIAKGKGSSKQGAQIEAAQNALINKKW